MNSLTELNNYNINLTIPFTDLRNANVVFDRLTPINQTVTIDSGFSFLSPLGIDITDIAQSAISLPVYTVSLFNLEGATLTWATLPSGVTSSTPSTRAYRLNGISSKGDWDIVKSPTINLPANYTGTFTFTSTISYYSATAGNQTVSWTTTVTVVEIVFLRSTSDFIYTDGTNEVVTGQTSIRDIDAAYPGATWTLTATPSIITSITTWTTTGTGGTFSVNGSTKVITISGTRAQVNARLAGLKITTNTTNVDFTLNYAVSNSLNSNTDSKLQIFKSYDLSLLGPVTGFNYVEDNKNILLTGYPVITDITRDGSGTYTLTITPSNTGAIEFIDQRYSPKGNDTFNPTTKVLTIYGTRSEVNDKLSKLYIWFGEDFTANFTLTYLLNNPIDVQKTRNQVFQCTTTDNEVTNMNITRSFLGYQGNSIFSSSTPYISDSDVSGTTNDYYNPGNDSYSITLSSSIGSWSYYAIDPADAIKEVGHANLSSSFGLMITHDDITQTTPPVTTRNKIKNFTVVMSTSSALSFKVNKETAVLSSIALTGTKSLINGTFLSITFFPTPGTGSGTFVYTQSKNGVQQVSQTTSLTWTANGSVPTRVVSFTSSTTWEPTRQEGLYGKITDLLVVGGGGGGSTGGGGGGQAVEASNINLSNQIYTITVGQGGNKQASAIGNASNGGSSSAFGTTALGGQGAQGVNGGGSYTWGGIFNAGGVGGGRAYTGPDGGLGGGGAGSGDLASTLYVGAPPRWPLMEGGTITYTDYTRWVNRASSSYLTGFPGPGIYGQSSAKAGYNAQLGGGGLGAVLKGYFGDGYFEFLDERYIDSYSIAQNNGTKSSSAGGTYSNIAAQTISGGGEGARFTVVRKEGVTGMWSESTVTSFFITNGGSGYSAGSVLKLPYNLIGESNPTTGNLIIDVRSVYSTPTPNGPNWVYTYNTGYGFGGCGGSTYQVTAPSGSNFSYSKGTQQALTYGGGIMYNTYNNTYTMYNTAPLTDLVGGGGGAGGSTRLQDSPQNGMRGIVRIKIGTR